MTQWLPEDTWALVPCGLADHPDVLPYISLAETTAAPVQAFRVWRAKIEQRRTPHSGRKSQGLRNPLNPLPCPAVSLNDARLRAVRAEWRALDSARNDYFETFFIEKGRPAIDGSD